MSEWEDRHSGERLFIIGNGPSLNDTPLERLDNEYSMAMNQISLIYDETTWRPDYYIFINTNVDNKSTTNKDRIENARKTIDTGVPSFVLADGKRHFGKKGNIEYIPKAIDKHGQLDKAAKGHGIKNVWSEDISTCVYSLGSTIYTAAQVASYMGFDKIYFVGCDLWEPQSFKIFNKGNNVGDFDFNSNTFAARLYEYLIHSAIDPINLIFSLVNAASYKFYDILPDGMLNDPNHFSDDYQPMGEKNENINKKFSDIHRVIKHAGSIYGFETYNATIGGYLEVYERVDIKNVL
jgi:hypothetical protein